MSYITTADRILCSGIRSNDPLAMRELARALRLGDGNVVLVARQLNCSARTLSGWAREHAHVAAMVEGGWRSRTCLECGEVIGDCFGALCRDCQDEFDFYNMHEPETDDCEDDE